MSFGCAIPRRGLDPALEMKTNPLESIHLPPHDFVENALDGGFNREIAILPMSHVKSPILFKCEHWQIEERVRFRTVSQDMDIAIQLFNEIPTSCQSGAAPNGVLLFPGSNRWPNCLNPPAHHRREYS
jgi:hypothetical protein